MLLSEWPFRPGEGRVVQAYHVLAVVGHLPSCEEWIWISWHRSLLSCAQAGPSESTEGCPFPFGRMLSLTPSRSQNCISCTASCLWRRVGLGSPVLPPPAESAAAASWTCLRETTARLGSCGSMCLCSVPSSVAPACLMPCACTAKVGPPSLSTPASLFWSSLCPSLLPVGPMGLEGCCSLPGTSPRSVFCSVGSLISSSNRVWPFLLFFPPCQLPSSSSPFPTPVLFVPSPPCPTCPVPLPWFGWVSPAHSSRPVPAQSHLHRGSTYLQEQAGG